MFSALWQGLTYCVAQAQLKHCHLDGCQQCCTYSISGTARTIAISMVVSMAAVTVAQVQLKLLPSQWLSAWLQLLWHRYS
jgi:hypothetical protein